MNISTLIFKHFIFILVKTFCVLHGKTRAAAWPHLQVYTAALLVTKGVGNYEKSIVRKVVFFDT